MILSYKRMNLSAIKWVVAGIRQQISFTDGISSICCIQMMVKTKGVLKYIKRNLFNVLHVITMEVHGYYDLIVV